MLDSSQVGLLLQQPRHTGVVADMFADRRGQMMYRKAGG